MKFKSDIEVQAGLKDSSGSAGSSGQLLSSTTSGTSWINPPATPGSGGSSQVFYFNGGTASTVVGYEQMSIVANTGAAVDFSINANGYIASFLTDVASPNQLNIPAGNWNFEIYMSASSSGGTPSFYVELYKYSSVGVFTSIANSSGTPEGITNGTAIDLYTTALAVPTTSLLITDRLAVRIYVTHSGRTITMHTQNGHLSEVITTFSTGLTALNNLTAQVQYFAVGTAGTDFGISSATDTHTFNLPTASASNRGALSSADWITFNSKANASGTTNYVSKFTGTTTLGNSLIYDNGTNVGIGTTSPGAKLDVITESRVSYSAGSQYRIRFTNTDGNGRILVDGDDSALILGTTVAGGSTATERMRIDSDGNVGIGTSGPAYRLDIADSTIDGFNFKVGNTYYNRGVKIGTHSSNVAAIQGIINNTGVYANLLLNPDGGNVGIGTTSPQAKLHSNSDILTGYFQNGTDGIYDALKLTNNTASNTLSGNGARIQFYNNSNNGTNLLGGSIRSVNVDYGWASDLVLSSVQNNGYASQTVNDAIWIKSSGNVGIGTSSPQDKFVVLGPNGNAGLEIGNLSNTESYVLSYNRSIADYTGFRIITNSSNNTFVATPSGNVGIGTSSPGSYPYGGKLNVNGDISSSGGKIGWGITDAFTAYGNSIAHYGMSWSNGSIPVAISGYYGVGFFTTGSEKMRIDPLGNVAIGTTIPSAKLDVTDSMSNPTVRIAYVPMSGYGGGGNIDIVGGYSDYVSGAISWKNGTTVQGQIDYNGGNRLMTLTSQYYMDFRTLSMSRMYINSMGYVGIGTTSPMYTLHVNGSVAGTSAYINLSDERYKKDILPIENALDKVLSLNGVTFNWNKEFNPETNLDDTNHIGLIAQEVEKVIPQAVSTASDDNQTKSVAYSDLVPVLIEAIKEQQKQIEELKKLINK
jgi:hypothetical protein